MYTYVFPALSNVRSGSSDRHRRAKLPLWEGYAQTANMNWFASGHSTYTTSIGQVLGSGGSASDLVATWWKAEYI